MTSAELTQSPAGRMDLDKPLYTLSIAAEILEIHPRTLMMYEALKLVIPQRTSTNRRRYSQRDLLTLAVDLTPEADHTKLESQWSQLLRAGTLAGPYELAMPDVTRINVEFSATANFTPGRHLAVFALPTIDPSSVRSIAASATA